MTFAIITHVPHILDQNTYFAYGPYVREMNIWTKYVDEVILVAPKSDSNRSPIDTNYEHRNIKLYSIESFDILSIKAFVKMLFKIPKNCWQIFVAMQKADHIHLRCPGNIGLLGCWIQIFFPNKPKTAKYAGNWDPKSKQPWTYRLQKWILSTTFLTRNMQVLIYGEWEGTTSNCKSFFTATYKNSDRIPIPIKKMDTPIAFLFVGALVKGKNPLYAIQLVEGLSQMGHKVQLSLFGEGTEREKLQDYIEQNKLENYISLEGNQSQENVKEYYKRSHFVILPSESEGWPKAIAEAMFWGCVPIAKAVSCVPYMLDYGKRGLLVNLDLKKDLEQLDIVVKNENLFTAMSQKASNWSQKYTLDIFETEIKKMLQS
jgi:glycosyltransferase involved in cell wall biosynthesis